MSHQPSPNPNASEVPAVEGHMNALFEVSSNKTGNDAPATCGLQNPLYRIGTAPRVQFDKRNEMTVQVKFKLHSDKEVEVDNQPACIKATKHKGCVTIFSESQKEKARKVAQACAAKELITSARGPSASESEVRVLTKELEDARKRIALHELTAQLFHDHAQKGNSGDGVVLVCPWDPKILYRLTWSGAWVWAKVVQAGMATREIPPRTYEYLAIMKKSRVYHKAMKVDDRVKMRSGDLHLDLSPTFNKAGGSHQSFFEPPAKLLFQKPMAGGSKRSAIFSTSDDGERNDKKKIKVEPGFEDEKRGIKPTKRITIVLSSDPPSPSPIIKREPDQHVIFLSSSLFNSPSFGRLALRIWKWHGHYAVIGLT
ncbi:uncharacterized protein MELLADRAFT_104207 [Melampsora larici-populina 98AG31]|uniref:Uncharacterized protein n=1 Tax=Melampsora larici-populina (strain 98AG31 / pathotype 3-4-7) TaxID=747676 RepID=F4RDX8_MELLP|nr:uncharacterized protein MELLADRAFT_104207 [Melampsora larici-populina 98AG31]EGG09480.1 hypothetical protein MELLADRAFT_104207 [Melampsora larici-populina 98AG31]